MSVERPESDVGDREQLRALCTDDARWTFTDHAETKWLALRLLDDLATAERERDRAHEAAVNWHASDYANRQRAERAEAALAAAEQWLDDNWRNEDEDALPLVEELKRMCSWGDAGYGVAGRAEAALAAAREALRHAETFASLPVPLSDIERAEWMTAKGRALGAIEAAVLAAGGEPE